MKQVAIVGYGLEGKSAVPYWLEQGADVTVCDQNTDIELPNSIKRQLGPDYLQNLDRFDVIVRTVGMNPQIILDKNPGVAEKITTNINEFLRVCPTKNVIGVTGTKGKGTTSTLILKMLQTAGKQAFLGGNYGIPAFSFLHELDEDSWVVLELSSFMLSDIKYSPRIGVCLMVMPEHLDWHKDEEDYYHAKSNMFAFQTAHDSAIYYAENPTSHRIASRSQGRKIAYYAEPGAYVKDGKIMIDESVLCRTDELQLLGKHNWQNVCAAVTAFWQVAQTPDAIREVLTTFSGLENRLEFIREIEGVKFFNDSFASDPYATEAAIDAIADKKVLIVGGWDKRMLPLEQFAKHVAAAKNNLRTLLLIGESAARVAEALQKTGYNEFHVSTAKAMPDIVVEAQKLAQKGDTVLMSPGFPSFDMFKNFEVRGQEYKQAVHDL